MLTKVEPTYLHCMGQVESSNINKLDHSDLVQLYSALTLAHSLKLDKKVPLLDIAAKRYDQSDGHVS